MSDKKLTQGEKKATGNALLNAATGFSFFDDFSDATLLVPVSVQQEILKNTPEATSEIDLQSEEVSLDDDDDEPTPQHVTLFDDLPKEETKTSSDSPFISFFKKASDPQNYPVFPVLQNPPPPPPASVVVPNVELLKKSSPVEVPQNQPIAPIIAEKPPVVKAEPAVSLFSVPSSESPNDPFSTGVITAQSIKPTPPPPPPASTIFDSVKSTTSDFPVASLSSTIPLQVSSITTNLGTTKATPVPSSLYTPSAPTLETIQATAGTPSGDGLKNSAKSPPDVGPSSIGSVQSQATSNKYRLGSQRTARPQYAQYPGLLATNAQPQTPMVNMGNYASQPPPPVAGPPTTFIPSVNNSVTSTAPSYYNSQESTGYVFGEPPPVKTASTILPTPVQYSAVTPHWFYLKEIEGKGIWKPFSFLDSVALEDAFSNGQTTLTPTDGGRYDVDVMHRLRIPVYWEETPSEVRRCCWFYKGPLDNRFIPYEEDFAQQLEKEFEAAIATGIWQRRVELGGGEAIILHNPNVIVHFCQAASPDEWGNLPESQLRPRVVKRGIDKSFLIEDGESTQIDHLVFLVHGIGAICDFKFRSIVEAVDDFRSLSAQLLHTHFGTSVDKGIAGRIEFLPVCWHKSLHGDCGVDKKLKPITLNSIPKLRNFTNDTLLDILFYTSPVYCQRIVDTVGNEINRMYKKFLHRHTSFRGAVSLAGHSLGSLILFDLLTHQPAKLKESSTDNNKSVSEEQEQSNRSDETPTTTEQGDVTDTNVGSSKMVSYTIGQAGTGQPSIVYPVFDFHPTSFFAMGSPTAVFISVRGIEQLGEEFHLPTCQSFFNIFHPFDPVAYRMETLIDPTFSHPPVVIPHHKGRKRFHLEIKDAMFRMGTDLKQTMVETFKNTWKTFYQLASFGRADDSKNQLEQEIDRALEGELKKSVETQQLNEQYQAPADANITIGKLNGGRRIDHVLQEGPLESFNEYLFALSSHVCYWESEDTMLLLMREIYQTLGIFPDHSAIAAVDSTGQFPGGPPPQFPHLSGSTSYPDNLSQNPYARNSSSHPATPMYVSGSSASTPMTDTRPAPPPPQMYTSNNYSFAKSQQPSITNSNVVEPLAPQQQPAYVAFPNQSVPQSTPFVPSPVQTVTNISQQQQPSPFAVSSFQTTATTSQQSTPFVPSSFQITTSQQQQAMPFVPSSIQTTTTSQQQQQPSPFTIQSASQQQQQQPFALSGNQIHSQQSPFAVPLSQTVGQQPSPFVSSLTSQPLGATPLPGVVNSSSYSFPNSLNLSHPVLQPPRDPSPNAINNNLPPPQSPFARPQGTTPGAAPPGPIGPPPLSGFVRKS